MNSALILASLERAAAKAGDITPDVYARLFAQRPDLEAHFALDRDGGVRGAMLAHVIEAILDFIGPRAYAAHLIQCEVVTHAGYDVPPEDFGLFFAVLAEAVRAADDAPWDAETEAAWAVLLEALSFYVANPSQHATAALT